VSVPADRRRPASEARLFYEENPESIAQREKVIEMQRLERASIPQPTQGKPSKRNRRMIHRFTNKSE
jgi:ribosome-associated heat shock protein Hsp15